MNKKRDYIQEIIDKKERLSKRSDRYEQFTKRVIPIVSGFRAIKSLDAKIPFRNEQLKYCPIGYIACVEGYFRLLIRDLIDNNEICRDNVIKFKDIKFGTTEILAFHYNKVTIGEFISHLLPIRNIKDINSNISTLIDNDFLHLLKSKPLKEYNNEKTLFDIFPSFITDVEEFYRLRHIYAHELAIREKVKVKTIENSMGMTGLFVIETESLINDLFIGV